VVVLRRVGSHRLPTAGVHTDCGLDSFGADDREVRRRATARRLVEDRRRVGDRDQA
jgi:hypothetical protein